MTLTSGLEAESKSWTGRILGSISLRSRPQLNVGDDPS